jgi:hypothetical protein
LKEANVQNRYISSLHVNEFRYAGRIHELRVTLSEQEALAWGLNFKRGSYLHGDMKIYYIGENSCLDAISYLDIPSLYVNFSASREKIREELLISWLLKK